jgi:hypothetical protein
MVLDLNSEEGFSMKICIRRWGCGDLRGSKEIGENLRKS